MFKTTADQVVEDSSRRFVSDTEKSTWNAKASTSVATTSANGLMSSADKTKLNGIATNANNYSHPTSSGNKHIPSGGSSGQILRWSADGTTNKPKGSASRRPVLILRGTDNVNVVNPVYDKNLEVAGSYTFTGVPVNKGFNAFVEYSVSGLQGGTHYQKSNYVWIDPPTAQPKIKVNGAYKNVTNTYIKVNGAYKQVTEIYVKVGGVYKKIVN